MAEKQTIHGCWIDNPNAVTLIDAHHHLWDLDKNYYPWLKDHPEPNFFMGEYSALKRNYLPDDYRNDSKGHNVLKTVHVEAEWDRQTQVRETAWLSEIAAVHGMPHAIVAHAWFHTPNSAEILAEHARFPLVRGVRSKPVTALTPERITPGAPGTMQDPAWLEGFSRLAEHSFSWDLRVPYWHLGEAAEVASAFPATPIILNHTGFPWDRSSEGIAAWAKAMETIARCPNVHLKISEFGLKDAPWNYESNAAIVKTALSIFGVDRCMFASNFPVAGLRISYDELVRSVARMVAHLTEIEKEMFFWRNSAAFYRL